MYYSTSTKFRIAIGVLALSMPFFSPTLSIAQETHTGFDVTSYRIDIAARQRMLTQRMAKAICFIHEDVEVEMHLEILEGDYNLFKNSLIALRDGGGDYDLAPETDRKILTELEHVFHTWEKLDEIISQVLKAGEVLEDDEVYVSSHDLILLDDTDHAHSFVALEYANARDASMASSITMNIFGRQRMLSQRAAKDFCQVYGGHDIEEKRADLAETQATFTASLDALRNGMPDFGIAPPPNEEVANQLDVVAGIWQPMNDIFSRALAGDVLTKDDIAFVALENLHLQVEMNKAVQMYRAVQAYKN